MSNKYKGIAKEVTWLTKKVVMVVVAGFGELSYVPGQFVMVEIGDDLKRAYGIANAPINGKRDEFELYVDVSPGGPGSKYFRAIEAGEEVEFSGPYGQFVLDEKTADSEDPLILLTTGTGIAPLKSMVEALLFGDYKDSPKQHIQLCMGLRYAQDVFLNTYFEDLNQEHDRFHFTVTLSKPNTKWTGCAGYVTEHIGKSQEACYFVCGGKETVQNIIKKLKEDGIKSEKIHFEQF